MDDKSRAQGANPGRDLAGDSVAGVTDGQHRRQHSIGKQSPRSEPLAVFNRFRAVYSDARKKRRVDVTVSNADPTSEPFAKGRDPGMTGGAIDELVRDRGWTEAVARAQLLNDWADVVGAATAEHATIVDLRGTRLRVQCDSTAWATQLGLLRGQLLVAISNRFPDAAIEQIQFLGPDVPSWKYGPRSVRGRGPRDTYG